MWLKRYGFFVAGLVCLSLAATLNAQGGRPRGGGGGGGGGFSQFMRRMPMIGTVAAVNGNEIVVNARTFGRGGGGESQQKLITSAQTKVQRGAKGSKSDIAKGQYASVSGRMDPNGNFRAEQISVSSNPGRQTRSYAGKIYTVKGNTFGINVGINIPADVNITKFTAIQPGAVKVGESIMANGERREDGSMDASTVTVGEMQSSFRGFGGRRGGRGGDRGGRGGDRGGRGGGERSRPRGGGFGT